MRTLLTDCPSFTDFHTVYGLILPIAVPMVFMQPVTTDFPAHASVLIFIAWLFHTSIFKSHIH